jgi:hypothetical protein
MKKQKEIYDKKAIPNCLTTNGIEGFVVSPVRITPKGYYPYKQVS